MNFYGKQVDLLLIQIDFANTTKGIFEYQDLVYKHDKLGRCLVVQ